MSANAYGGADRHQDLAGLGLDNHPQYGMNLSGTFAARPAFGRAGRLYVATDSGQTYFDTGSAWIAVAPSPFVGVRATASGVQNIPNATETSVALDTETYKTLAGLHSTSVNNSRVTIPAGTPTQFYDISGSVKWAGNATGIRGLYVKKNGATYLLDTGATTPTANDTYQSVIDTIQLAANDYVELRVYQSSGGALGLHGDAQNAGCTRLVLKAVGA